MSLNNKKITNNKIDKGVNKRSVIFANIVLVSGIIFLTLGIIYKFTEINSIFTNRLLFIYYLVSVCAIGLFVFALRWREDNKVSFSIIVTSIVFFLYLSETYLLFLSSSDPHKQSTWAKKKGVPFDTRTKFQVVRDLREKNIDAYPTIGSSAISINEKIVPLTYISNKTTVFCNENGQYIIYKTDEHGFNNPPNLYAKKEEIDMVLIGDSFTRGACVNPSDNIAGNLMKAGYKVINLGIGGTGPLKQLATIKEYAEVLTPKIVLWFYWEGGDLFDLTNEKNNSLFMRYVNEDFSQNLINRQEEIDSLLKKVVEMEFEKEKEEERRDKRFHSILMKVVKLRNLRERLGLIRPITVEQPPPSPLFIKIIDKAHKLVSSWDGELVFVYLPAWERYSPGQPIFYFNPASLKYHDQVLSIVASRNIPIIDVSEVFNSHPDPLSLFPFRTPAHYTAEGYALVAERVVKFLENY